MPNYDAILFDFDGVLADSEPLHHACWREVLEPLGIQLDWETFRDRCIGVSDWEIIQMLAREAEPPSDPHLLWQARPYKQKLFEQRAEADPPVLPATVEMIKKLFNYKLAVVTSSERSEVEPMLIASGIRPSFGVLVTAADVERPKPAPDPYLRAAALLGSRQPLVVEDSDTGVRSAEAAGFDVLKVESAESVPKALCAWLNRSCDFR